MVFSKRFSKAIFRGKPETYLLELQSIGLRNVDGGISCFRAAGDDGEVRAFLVVGRWFLKLFLTGLITDLKNEVMRVW